MLERMIEKPWGYERVINKFYDNGKLTAIIKHLHINKKQRLSLQYHKQKVEVMLLVNGKAMITIQSNGLLDATKICNMEYYQPYRINPGVVHRLEGKTDCDIIEIANSSNSNDIMRLADDYGRL